MKTIEVVAGMLREGDRFMICQRPAHKARPLKWEFPGGKIEPGETPQMALKRELKEELDIEVDVCEALAETTYTYPDITVHLTLYTCRLKSGIPKLIEHESLAWIDSSEISRYSFCEADMTFLTGIFSEH